MTQQLGELTSSGRSSSRESAQSAAAAEPTLFRAVLVPLLSMVVIAMTAFLMQAMGLPSEVLAPLSTAAGALVPAFEIWRSERRRSKVSKMTELASGRFKRPPVYVVIVAAGILSLTSLLTGLVGAIIATISLADALASGLLTEAEYADVMEAGSAVGIIILLMLVASLVVSAPVGSYVAHRIPGRPLLWAVGAAMLSVVLIYVLSSLAVGDWSVPSPWEFVFVFLPHAIGITLGAWWGSRTRAMFWAKRLFRNLSEPDRRTVLSLMEDSAASVAGD
jgi:hypothetical protein